MYRSNGNKYFQSLSENVHISPVFWRIILGNMEFLFFNTIVLACVVPRSLLSFLIYIFYVIYPFLWLVLRFSFITDLQSFGYALVLFSLCLSCLGFVKFLDMLVYNCHHIWQVFNHFFQMLFTSSSLPFVVGFQLHISKIAWYCQIHYYGSVHFFQSLLLHFGWFLLFCLKFTDLFFSDYSDV